jgi:hypothetical protein
MTVGAWLATIVGPRDVFLYLSLATAVSVMLAFGLDESAQPARVKKPVARDRIFPRPDSLDMLIFWMGAGIDGVFTVSISLMWAQYVSTEMAILFGGSILAARRLSEMLVAPCSGIIADRFGIRLPLTLMIALAIAGFVMIGAWAFGSRVGCIGIGAWCLGNPCFRPPWRESIPIIRSRHWRGTRHGEMLARRLARWQLVLVLRLLRLK